MLSSFYQDQPAAVEQSVEQKAIAPDISPARLLAELKDRSWELSADDRASVVLCLLRCIHAPKQVKVKESWDIQSNGALFWVAAAQLDKSAQKCLADWLMAQQDGYIPDPRDWDDTPVADDDEDFNYGDLCGNGQCNGQCAVDTAAFEAFDAYSELLEDAREWLR